MNQQDKWHDDVYFGIHYDLHATENDGDLGSGVTHENLRVEWSKVRPDWVQCDCKGHRGWTSWPSDLGNASPGIVRDALRIHADVCREMGIRLGMHYSGVIDELQMRLHPDWACIDAEGSLSRSTCLLSPYLDELMIPQMLELIEKYDVDGFWVDGDNWAVRPCYCQRCRSEFSRRTGITEIPREAGQPGWHEWLAFHRDLFTEFVAKYTKAVHERKPSCAVCSNWMYTLRMPEQVAAPIDYISGDYMANFGLYRAALEARFMSGRGISWDLMCWGFTKDYANGFKSAWKTAEHLKQEVTEVIAHGGAIMIYGKPQRNGHLVGWHHDIKAEVARFCEDRKPFCFQSESASQAAVLHLADHYYHHNDPCFNYGDCIEPVEGALHSLLETHHSVDVLNEPMILERLDRYRLVVVPEQTHLSAALQSALEKFARGGGTVLFSGAHLPAEAGDLLGVRPAASEAIPAAFNNRNGLHLAVEGQAFGLLGPWIPVELSGAMMHTPALAGNDPIKDTLDTPAITARRLGQGKVLGIYGSIFRTFFQNHDPVARRFLRGLYDGLDIDWAVRAIDAPPSLELIARRKDGRLMINLVNRSCGEMTYPQRVVVDRVPPIRDIRLELRCDSRPDSITREPAGTPVPFAWDPLSNIAKLEIGRVGIHDILVVSNHGDGAC